MFEEQAACDYLAHYLKELGKGLDEFLSFEHPDAMSKAAEWKKQLGSDVPEQGIGIDKLIDEMNCSLLPNGSAIPRPGFSSFITTGASTSAVLANLAGSVASPQRYSLTAFNYLEELSLEWLRNIFCLPETMKGLYSSGGSVANLVALGAARQQAFEAIGIDPALDGVSKACRIYVSDACHHTVHRAAAVLGLGRASVVNVPVDRLGRISVSALKSQIEKEQSGVLKIAIVANAGSTDTGAIDPIDKLADLAEQHAMWLHVDGAYGLPGILDPEIKHLFNGLARADSVSVDPHKWLGAPVGIGATFVKDRSLLFRAFTQEAANYLEGAFSDKQALHSMDSMGIPYGDFGVELSAPARGVVVWAIIKEIGLEGLRDRICRHNAMAKKLAQSVKEHPELELALEPTLSICCFRFAPKNGNNLNELNKKIHRQLVHNGRNIPSTTVVDNKFVIRPCFVGARASWQQVDDLIEEVLHIGHQLIGENK